MNVNLVYDIETFDAAWVEYLSTLQPGEKPDPSRKRFNDTFLCGGTWSLRDGLRVFHRHQENELVDYILSHGGNAFAHSGGSYDHLWAIDNAVRRGKITKQTDLIASGPSRLITARIAYTALFDSWAIAPMPLEKLTRGLGTTKSKLDVPCICGESCKGFCALSPNMPTDLYNKTVAYMMDDVESLRQALERLFDFAGKHGIEIKATIGATAWNYARKVCNLPVATWDVSDYRYIRKAYNGGYTKAVRHVRGVDARVLDVNSSYPTTMARYKFPIGAFVRCDPTLASKLFASGSEGIVTATVFVPSDTYMPTLAYREPDGPPLYPTGTFRGTWTALSLRKAVERGEAIIKSIHHALFWPETAEIYSPFVSTMYGIRREEIDISPEGKDSALGTWAKLVANSLSGKLGARPQKRRYTINGIVKGCTCLQADCTCGSSTPVSDHVVETNVFRIDQCAHIHHAAYVTSDASQRLFDAAKSVGHSKVIYFDTDSVFAYRDADFSGVKVGKELGEWSSNDVTDLHVYGAKLYEYTDEKLSRKVKAKGASRPTSAKPGTLATSRGVTGLKKMLAHGFQSNVIHRRLNETWADRVSIDGIETRAKDVNEL